LWDILCIGSLNKKNISLFSWGSFLASLATRKEPSNFLDLTLGFFDKESRVRAWIESLCVCGSLFRAQKLRDLKHKHLQEKTRKEEE